MRVVVRMGLPGGVRLRRKHNWLSAEPYCSWDGVFCGASGRANEPDAGVQALQFTPQPPSNAWGTVRDCTGLYGTVRDCTGLCGTVRDCAGLYGSAGALSSKF